MSVELIVEVLKHAPADLNPTERLTLVVIAESCRTGTRSTFYRDDWDADELARRVGITAESLTKVFRSLARKGLEVRVPHAVKHGKPVFAFKGRQTTFRLPRLASQRVDEGPGFDPRRVDDGPGIEPAEEAKDWTSVRESLDERPGNGPQSLDESPPLLLKELPSIDPSLSSLSPEDHLRPAAGALVEREISKSEDQTSPEERLLASYGVTREAVDFVRRWINARFSPMHYGWWKTAHGNSTLRLHVAAALRDFRNDPHCLPPAQRDSCSPADRVVADNAALYARYARQSSRHVPYRNPVDDSVYDAPL